MQMIFFSDVGDTYGWGMRQVQVGLLFGALSMAYVFRINMSICIVEMTENTDNRTVGVCGFVRECERVSVFSF